MTGKKPLNPHFIAREENGSARIRIRFTAEEASLIEEAAGSTPVMEWIYQTLNSAAKLQAAENRQQRRKAPPPGE